MPDDEPEAIPDEPARSVVEDEPLDVGLAIDWVAMEDSANASVAAAPQSHTNPPPPRTGVAVGRGALPGVAAAGGPLRRMGARAHRVALAHNPPPRSTIESLALLHSRVTEAVIASAQPGFIPAAWSVETPDWDDPTYTGGPGKPSGFPILLAAILLDVLDLAASLDVDLDDAVRLTLAYADPPTA